MSSFQALFFLFFTEVQLVYSLMFISAVEQSEPVMHVQALCLMFCSSFLFIIFFFTRVERTEG